MVENMTEFTKRANAARLRKRLPKVGEYKLDWPTGRIGTAFWEMVFCEKQAQQYLVALETFRNEILYRPSVKES